jgi:DNA-binding CsgD family transcriptional regulator
MSPSTSNPKARAARAASVPALARVRPRANGLGPSPGVVRSLFEAAPEAMAILDASLRVVLWNKAAAQLTGQPASEAIGRRCAIDGHRVRLERPDGPVSADRVRPRLTSACEFWITAKSASTPPLAAMMIPLGQDRIVLLMLFRRPPWLVDLAASSRPSPPARYHAERLARPARPAAIADGRSLTLREREILRLLAAGKAAKAIATELALSLPTVRSHTQHILRKLGLHRSLEAVVWFLRNAADGDRAS